MAQDGRRRTRSSPILRCARYDAGALAQRDFFSDAAKTRAAGAVRTIEGHTAAEIVITLRRASGAYRDACLRIASAVAFVVLLLLLFLPQSFDTAFMPIDVLLGFAIAYAVAVQSDALRRFASSRKAQAALVDAHAKAAFVDLGVARTTGRTGVLVYVSMLERRVRLVGDTALQTADLARALTTAGDELSETVARADFTAFITRLEALGPALASALPRSADDVNELPDEVQ